MGHVKGLYSLNLVSSGGFHCMHTCTVKFRALWASGRPPTEMALSSTVVPVACLWVRVYFGVGISTTIERERWSSYVFDFFGIAIIIF